MSTTKFLFWVLLVVTALAVILLAATMADSAGAAGADPDCHFGCPPKLIYRIFMPFAEQCLGAFCGWEHSGPPDGEPVR